MERIITYFLGQRYDEFVEKLREEGFIPNVEASILSSRDDVDPQYLFGFLHNSFMFVHPEKKNFNTPAEVAERSRLLQIADEF